MLSLQIIKQIVRLLDMGNLTQRQIAEKLHVSRSTVLAIAKSRYVSQTKARKRDRATGREQHRTLRSDTVGKRCQHCGYVVHLPCRICATRRELLLSEVQELVVGVKCIENVLFSTTSRATSALC